MAVIGVIGGQFTISRFVFEQNSIVRPYKHVSTYAKKKSLFSLLSSSILSIRSFLFRGFSLLSIFGSPSKPRVPFGMRFGRISPSYHIRTNETTPCSRIGLFQGKESQAKFLHKIRGMIIDTKIKWDPEEIFKFSLDNCNL